uniref:Retrotransposon protein, putative, Ty3-gypsy subclass n=1 Tax=Oryza sativa subsp. japonica TaxID=39947 RepID=Q2QTG6_ORYSJ|nr:retrotransposon protein, putative, Ty3-gypsy subclass [Oryza sativa Japonica Group]
MDGRDRSGPRRLTADDPDDVSGDVTDSGGGSAEKTARTAHARRRTAALGRKRRAPRRRGQHGELTGDLNGGGRPTDGDGDEEEAAKLFGSTAAKLIR